MKPPLHALPNGKGFSISGWVRLGIKKKVRKRVGFGSGRSVEISDRVFSGTLFDLRYYQASLVFPGIML